MPKKQNTLQALADEVVAEILSSASLKALDNKLINSHPNGFFYEIGYDDNDIEILINLKYHVEEK